MAGTKDHVVPGHIKFREIPTISEKV